ncbi:hypothetical protein T484DRAFT_2302412 [Baffinella frigidus]|nr:hypothetical protein T484DRAFT_2302412 [Cryptophyta sp. CCMP2293]
MRHYVKLLGTMNHLQRNPFRRKTTLGDLLKEGSEDFQASDLFVVRSPDDQASAQVMEELMDRGWTYTDLSLSKSLYPDRLEAAAKLCKVSIVFVTDELVSASSLSSNLPIVRLFLASLVAHGFDEKTMSLGSNNLLLVSQEPFKWSGGNFPGGAGGDTRPWPGLIGERLEHFRSRIVACPGSSTLPAQVGQTEKALLEGPLPAGPHGTKREREGFFSASKKKLSSSFPPSPLVPTRPSTSQGFTREDLVDQSDEAEEEDTLESVTRRVDRILEASGLELKMGVDMTAVMPVEVFFQKSASDPLEFWMLLEDEFAMEIPDSDAATLQQIRAIYRYMFARVRSRAKEALHNPLLSSATPAIVRHRHPRTGVLMPRPATSLE